jgi:hypothetical protein
MTEERTLPMLEGELYVVRNGRLQHIERFNDLPKVEVSDTAKEALRALQRRCRRVLGGFRPDIALVASALIEHAAALPQARDIVQAYACTVLGGESEASPTGSESSR